ncbi:MAG: galactose-1-phosphate uridylyltransferase [Nitrospirae bacterium]|nr:galactose-1-phosphate uridylyltransferase [Nitrospirota bacterium]
MHELRKDPILGQWVIVFKNESKRPSEYASLKEPPDDPATCPLCEGKEMNTPHEIRAIRKAGTKPDKAGWLTRVIPDFQPLLQIEGDLNRQGIGMYDKMDGIGANEIIIETPEHFRAPEDAGMEQIVMVISTYKERILDLEKDPRLRYILIFKNHGKAAGARFSHPHSQLVATPIIPSRVKEELDGAKLYYNFKDRCIFCDIIREDVRMGDRIILENRSFVALCPFASRFPFEMWILPKKHNCAFQDINREEEEDLAITLITIVGKLKKLLDDPPYNSVLHTAPSRIPRRDHWHTLGEDFHWHIEIMPRLTRTAGFEWGSGSYVLPTSPEDCAKYLREV